MQDLLQWSCGIHSIDDAFKLQKTIELLRVMYCLGFNQFYWMNGEVTPISINDQTNVFVLCDCQIQNWQYILLLSYVIYHWHVKQNLFLLNNKIFLSKVDKARLAQEMGWKNFIVASVVSKIDNDIQNHLCKALCKG